MIAWKHENFKALVIVIIFITLQIYFCFLPVYAVKSALWIRFELMEKRFVNKLDREEFIVVSFVASLIWNVSAHFNPLSIFCFMPSYISYDKFDVFEVVFQLIVKVVFQSECKTEIIFT